MVRGIALFTSLFLALSSVAWASDAHEEALAAQHVAEASDSSSDDSPSKALTPCDHCCHGSGHQIALEGIEVESALDFMTHMHPVYSYRLAVRQDAPPIPPPKR